MVADVRGGRGVEIVDFVVGVLNTWPLWPSFHFLPAIVLRKSGEAYFESLPNLENQVTLREGQENTVVQMHTLLIK